MLYCDILCLIIVLTLFILIVYQKYYTINIDNSTYVNKAKNETEPFLALNDVPLYTSKNEMNKAISIKAQIPSPVNQLNDNELQHIDGSILRHNRVLKTFSMVDELDIYQMYNIIKQLKNNQYNFTFNTNNTSTPSSSIISSDKLNTINSGAINNVDLNLFTRMKLEIISAFNNFVINSGSYLPYHPYQFFKIINSNLISFDKNYKTDTTNNSIDNYCFTLTFAREYKYQQFIIYYDIDLVKAKLTATPTSTPTTTLTSTGTATPTQTPPTPTQTPPTPTPTNTDKNDLPILSYTMLLNKVEITGIPLPNTIEFHKNDKVKTDNTNSTDSTDSTDDTDILNTKTSLEEQLNKQSEIDMYYDNDFYYKDQVRESNKSDVMPSGENSKLFQRHNMKFIDETERSDIDSTLLNKDSIEAKIDEKIMNIAKDKQFNTHRCYGLVNGKNQELPQYKNPIFCKSYHPEINQNGIWDSPCQIDNDCPFYKANKNYTNEFGKCDKESGSCEMPLGVIPIGFTKYGKIEPNCYNCDITSKDSKCCGKQMNAIKSRNVNYKSPDYIFTNDELMRKQFKNELELIGLKANPSI
jgi:hypothetical protein